MNSILSLSSLVLVSFCNIAPAIAFAVETHRAGSPPPAHQPELSKREIAGVFEILTQTIQVTTGAMEMIHQQKQRDHLLRVQAAQEQERQARLAVEQRLREQEYEYKKMLAQLQLREADRRREEYLRLADAEKVVYLADQRSRKEVEAILFLELIRGLPEANPALAAPIEMPAEAAPAAPAAPVDSVAASVAAPTLSTAQSE